MTNEMYWLIDRLERSGDWDEIRMLIDQIRELGEKMEGEKEVNYESCTN